MPTYEYACTSCGEHLEVVQSFRDESLTVCPACGGALRKVFGSIGVVFKGSGFYKTDSRPAGKEPSSSKESAGASTETKTSSDSPSQSSGSSNDGAAASNGSGTSSEKKTSSPSTKSSSAPGSSNGSGSKAAS